jgi:hypothetical protein
MIFLLVRLCRYNSPVSRLFTCGKEEVISLWISEGRIPSE